jgi:hypothetical protein
MMELLPTCACVAGASCARGTDISCTYGIDTPNTSCTDSPITGVFWCTTASRKDLRGAMVGPPMLIADSATRVGCGGVTEPTAI